MGQRWGLGWRTGCFAVCGLGCRCFAGFGSGGTDVLESVIEPCVNGAACCRYVRHWRDAIAASDVEDFIVVELCAVLERRGTFWQSPYEVRQLCCKVGKTSPPVLRRRR